MTRLSLILLTVLLFAGVPATAAADDVPDQANARVVKVESGEVIIVQLEGARTRIKVRIIGIDCNDKKSRTVAATLVGREDIVLRSDKGFLPILEDQFGRYVAYVQMSDGRDLGLEMLKTGHCSTTQWKLPHPRVTEYASASR